MRPPELARLGHSLTTSDQTSDEDRAIYQQLRDAIEEDIEPLNEILKQLVPEALHSSRIKRIESVANKLKRKPELTLGEIIDLVGHRLITKNR